MSDHFSNPNFLFLQNKVKHHGNLTVKKTDNFSEKKSKLIYTHDHMVRQKGLTPEVLKDNATMVDNAAYLVFPVYLCKQFRVLIINQLCING